MCMCLRSRWRCRIHHSRPTASCPYGCKLWRRERDMTKKKKLASTNRGGYRFRSMTCQWDSYVQSSRAARGTNIPEFFLNPHRSWEQFGIFFIRTKDDCLHSGIPFLLSTPFAPVLSLKKYIHIYSKGKLGILYIYISVILYEVGVVVILKNRREIFRADYTYYELRLSGLEPKRCPNCRVHLFRADEI